MATIPLNPESLVDLPENFRREYHFERCDLQAACCQRWRALRVRVPCVDEIPSEWSFVGPTLVYETDQPLARMLYDCVPLIEATLQLLPSEDFGLQVEGALANFDDEDLVRLALAFKNGFKIRLASEPGTVGEGIRSIRAALVTELHRRLLEAVANTPAKRRARQKAKRAEHDERERRARRRDERRLRDERREERQASGRLGAS